jgi:hypothetical protein
MLKGIAVIAAALAAPVAAQGIFDNIVNKPSIAWQLYGANQSGKEVPASKEVPGGYAVRVAVTAPAPNAYDVGATLASVKPIAKGDKVVTMVFLRAPDVAAGSTIPVPIGISESNPPYTPIANETVQIGPTWKRYFAAGVAPKAFPAGQARIALQLGGAKQVLELGPGFLMDPGAGFDTASVPRN